MTFTRIIWYTYISYYIYVDAKLWNSVCICMYLARLKYPPQLLDANIILQQYRWFCCCVNNIPGTIPSTYILYVHNICWNNVSKHGKINWRLEVEKLERRPGEERSDETTAEPQPQHWRSGRAKTQTNKLVFVRYIYIYKCLEVPGMCYASILHIIHIYRDIYIRVKVMKKACTAEPQNEGTERYTAVLYCWMIGGKQEQRKTFHLPLSGKKKAVMVELVMGASCILLLCTCIHTQQQRLAAHLNSKSFVPCM